MAVRISIVTVAVTFVMTGTATDVVVYRGLRGREAHAVRRGNRVVRGREGREARRGTPA